MQQAHKLGSGKGCPGGGAARGQGRDESTRKLNLWAGQTSPLGAICPPGDPREQVAARRGALRFARTHGYWQACWPLRGPNSSGSLQEWRVAEAPPRPRPLPGAALNVGPRAPPAQLAAAISTVSEQLRCGLGGPALRPVSSLGSLCHSLGLGLGRTASGRVTERWEAPLSQPQFPLMGGRAPRLLQVVRSWSPGLSLLHGAGGVYCLN